MLAVLWRSGTPLLAVVIGFYLLSPYTADHLVPRVLVDGWPNFDGSEALRPWFILPDIVLAVALLRTRGRIDRRSLIVAGGIGLSALSALWAGWQDQAIPTTAALFWGTVPLRAMGMILLVAGSVRDIPYDRTLRAVVQMFGLAAVLLSVEILAVVALKAAARAMDLDLGSLWAGFTLPRPTLPGWNNNVAASAIALGSVTLLLVPAVHRPRPWLVALACALAAAALLATQYRTGILIFAGGLSLASGRWAFARIVATRRAVGAAAAGLAVGVTVLIVSVSLASVAVPRMTTLNPLAYALSIASGSPMPDPDISEGPDDPSTTSRSALVQASLTVWLRQPIIGSGLGAWEFTRPTEPSFLQRAITPHNGPAWALANLGIVGLATLYLVPFGIAMARRNWIPAILVGFVAILEVSTVGIAHARYGVMIWTLVWIIALGTRQAWATRPAASED